jgi:N-acyl-D-amino-acid deacylase
VGIIAKGMHPDDIAAILKWPESNLCSDGTAEGGHPRGWGSFTRVLGYYVREQKLLTLEEAIRKFTSLAADHVGIYGRGRITPGYYADLVLFDPLTVKDRASFASPHLPSEGIKMVWVNGKLVWQGKETGEKPGTKVLAD